MSDPSRLLAGESDDDAKALLESWSSRQPSEAARLKTLAAVGIGGALISSGAAGAVTPKVTLATSSFLKWVGIFVGGVAASAGVVGYVVAEHARSVEIRAASTASTAAAPTVTSVAREPLPLPAGPAEPALQARPPTVTDVAAASATALGGDVAPSAASSLPSSLSSSPAAAVARSAAKAHASTSSLDEEVLAIDRARRTLTGGDYAAALQLVDSYDERYPGGALAQESAEVRIEALYRSGQRAQADKLAARFLAANPRSPYVRVIRTLQAAPTASP
jgi:hypothetical protein